MLSWSTRSAVWMANPLLRGHGFSFDEFTVSAAPIPEPHAAVVFWLGLLVVTAVGRGRSPS